MFDHDYLSGVNFSPLLTLPVCFLAIFLRLRKSWDSLWHMAKTAHFFGGIQSHENRLGMGTYRRSFSSDDRGSDRLRTRATIMLRHDFTFLWTANWELIPIPLTNHSAFDWRELRTFLHRSHKSFSFWMSQNRQRIRITLRKTPSRPTAARPGNHFENDSLRLRIDIDLVLLNVNRVCQILPSSISESSPEVIRWNCGKMTILIQNVTRCFAFQSMFGNGERGSILPHLRSKSPCVTEVISDEDNAKKDRQ
jgi:hypothetical protein